MTLAATTQTLSTWSPLASLKRGLDAVFTGLINLAETNPRYQRVRTLQAMSDAQLAKKGLIRDDIVMHVFGHSF